MSIKQVIDGKKQWNELTKRSKSLPKDYQIVYKEIQKYISKVAPLDSDQIIELYTGVIDLFEYGASVGKPVLEVTGEDVAVFCDDLLISAPDYEENITEYFQKISLALVNSKVDIFEKYGRENITQLTTVGDSEKRQLLGLTVASIGSPIGIGPAGALPKYYLYKDQKVISVKGLVVEEYTIDRTKDGKYLANNIWFTKEL